MMALQLGPVIGQVGGAQAVEIPVAMFGRGSGNVHPMTTVDAGAGAWVWVDGALDPGNGTSATGSPQLQVGDHVYAVNGSRAGGGGHFTGTVAIAVTTRANLSDTSFSGTVYVIPAPA